MSKNRMVNTRFWSDGFIVDHCNALDKLLFLYLLTNERTNLVGIYELSLATAAFETGIDKSGIEKMILKFSPKIEYIDGWVYIRRFVDHQQSNPSVDKGMIRELSLIPKYIRDKVSSLSIDSYRLATAFDSVSETNDSVEQSVHSLSQTDPRVSVTKLNLTKPNGITSTNKSTDPNKSEIKKVFDTYIEAFGANPNRYKLSEFRKKKIIVRLRDAGSEMIVSAIKNVSTMPFYRGDNDRGWSADLDWILGSYEKVEKFANTDQPSLIKDKDELPAWPEDLK